MKSIAKTMLSSMGYDLKKTRTPERDFAETLRKARDYDVSVFDTLGAAFAAHCQRLLPLSMAKQFQDLFVDFILDKTGGVFCEFGAADGITSSNSAFLERERGWTGILSEPARDWHAKIVLNRPDTRLDRRCVYRESGLTLMFNEVSEGELSTISEFSNSDYFSGHRKDGHQYEVETISLDDLLDQNGIASLDYLSVDTEGSEQVILEAFDFDRFQPKVITVEHNYGPIRGGLQALIGGAGYARVLEPFRCTTTGMFAMRCWLRADDHGPRCWAINEFSLPVQ